MTETLQGKADRNYVFSSINPANFSQTRKNIESTLTLRDCSSILKKELYQDLASFCRYLAQIDGIREGAVQEARYFQKCADIISSDLIE